MLEKNKMSTVNFSVNFKLKNETTLSFTSRKFKNFILFELIFVLTIFCIHKYI